MHQPPFNVLPAIRLLAAAAAVMIPPSKGEKRLETRLEGILVETSRTGADEYVSDATGGSVMRRETLEK